jgi:hypothetical protein
MSRQANVDGPPNRVRGRTDWWRFGMLIVLTMTAVAVLIACAVPRTDTLLELLSRQQTPFKVSTGHFYAATAAVGTEPFVTREGDRRTEIVTRFNQLSVRDLCLSLRKRHRDLDYTIRILIPALRADNLTLGVDSLDGLGVLGQQISLRLPEILDGPAVRALPLTKTADPDPGALPIRFGNGLFSVGGTVRWITAHDFRVDGITLRGGADQPECY